MQTHITIHHPRLPDCTFHEGSAGDLGSDDFITLRIGTSLTDSLTLHFSHEEFRAWTRELDNQIRLLENYVAIAQARRARFMSMTSAQVATLMRLCTSYGVPFDPLDYAPQFDLPSGYLAGWIGGIEHGEGTEHQTIYGGVDPEGAFTS